MCDKAILENGRAPKSDCYKNQKMSNQAVDNYAHALEFVSNCCKTHNMCNKAANIFASAIQFDPE